ncbi:MAG: aromatic-ring-hydroxylating dioxygenase subunit beta [Pigmentiphaga sp.]|uniref:aromatic-ring-hydroxylating dioxygenase subunit beta n=1 Tax=Pigmentiphaga sp. TaxID=1977564 RepID=UPI0029A95E28|nr:aromatic-ring-hydroxylating dioxygenase subunit beta [Pigmentiphaga sp.]MDX3906762.1 aromatic-ring-hydroxylating dioxygenase subunit beta [Pigmentiphaga sp.]
MTETLNPLLIELLHTEARYLDEQRWQDWLALYEPDAVYWVPAWKADHRPTDDPATEISLIYAAGRHRLEERVKRATGTKSLASQPLPRTLHCISNATVEAGADSSTWLVRSYCVTHIYDLRTEALRTTACRCEHTLVVRDGTPRIARKKALLINDKVPTVLDFYCL